MRNSTSAKNSTEDERIHTNDIEYTKTHGNKTQKQKCTEEKNVYNLKSNYKPP